MTQLSPILRTWTYEGVQHLLWWCPGCKHAHHVPVDQQGGIHPNWAWNGSAEKPSLTPSVRHFYAWKGEPEVTECHYFITDGEIRYCGDCQHELSGQSVPLPPLPPASEYGYPDEHP